MNVRTISVNTEQQTVKAKRKLEAQKELEKAANDKKARLNMCENDAAGVVLNPKIFTDKDSRENLEDKFDQLFELLDPNSSSDNMLLKRQLDESISQINELDSTPNNSMNLHKEFYQKISSIIKRYHDELGDRWFNSMTKHKIDIMPAQEKNIEKIGKALLAVGVAVGVAIGCAIIGALIGAAATSWSGPGAALGAFIGLLKGAAVGWAHGVVIGSTVAGITTGSIVGYGLFKTPEKQKHINKALDEVNEGVAECGGKLTR